MPFGAVQFHDELVVSLDGLVVLPAVALIEPDGRTAASRSPVLVDKARYVVPHAAPRRAKVEGAIAIALGEGTDLFRDHLDLDADLLELLLDDLGDLRVLHRLADGVEGGREAIGKAV